MKSTRSSHAALTISSAGIPTRTRISICAGVTPCFCSSERAFHRISSAWARWSGVTVKGWRGPAYMPGEGEIMEGRGITLRRTCRVAGEMVESTPSNMRLFMARTSTGYAVLVKTPPVLRFGQIDMFSYMHSIYAFGTDSKHIPRQQDRMLSSDAPGIAKDVTYDTSTL